jgi:hypothetical protein
MPSHGFSLTPILQALLQRTGLALPPPAAETMILAPAETTVTPPSYRLDGQLDRVTGVAEHSSRALEQTRLGSVPFQHRATTAYRIENAVFAKGCLCTSRMIDRQSGERRGLLPVRISDDLDTAVLPLNHFAAIYFGHTVLDGGASMMLAPRFGEACIDSVVSAGMEGHVDRYFALFGLSHRPVRNVRIRNAWIFDDIGMNSHKSARLKQMSARVRTLPTQRTGHGVFIRRRGWGVNRAPQNEAQLEEFFAGRGFDIIDPRDLTVDQIATRIIGAAVVVGVEGSGMIHGMLALEPGRTVVMLLPPSRLNNMMKDYADGLGLRYGFVIGHTTAQGYTIDAEEILRTIDLVPG